LSLLLDTDTCSAYVKGNPVVFNRFLQNGGGGGVKIVKGERRLNKVRISMYVKWEDWNDISNEVIDPLAKEGADLTCQVIVSAQGDAAIRENTVELGIKESLSQRGIKADIQTG
jgi:hypothetical protein